MSDSFDFNDLSVIEIPVSISGKKYVLREADEETAAIYNNARLKGIPVKDSEVVGLPEDVGGIQSLLVSCCLFHLDNNGKATSQHVDRDIVKRWPSKVVKPLFVKAKEISELDDKSDLKSLEKQRNDLDKTIRNLKEEEEKTKNS